MAIVVPNTKKSVITTLSQRRTCSRDNGAVGEKCIGRVLITENETPRIVEERNTGQPNGNTKRG
jgi:hypothetical protein